MIARVQQDFIFGIKIPKKTKVDVKGICIEHNLDYVCAGDFDDEIGTVIGVKLMMKPIIEDEVMGKGEIQPFMIEEFLQSYHEAKECLNGEKINQLKKDILIQETEPLIPILWTVSHME